MKLPYLPHEREQFIRAFGQVIADAALAGHKARETMPERLERHAAGVAAAVEVERLRVAARKVTIADLVIERAV